MLLNLLALRQPRSIPIALISGGLLLGLWLAVALAQVPSTITSDGTLGTAVTQRGNIYDITGGTRPGNGPNLFHSFDRFSVGTNDTARFSGPTAIENILSRVTGGQQSVIDGRLQSRIPGANLYLLNPSGVLFGPNATLDVSGSFHVSTADFLRFADGATFSARLGDKTTLTVAPPAAFGFLTENPAPLTIQGSSLQVLEGKALSVVGGDVQIMGGTLVAPSGRIQLASVASPGEVMFSPLELAPDLQVESFARLGRLDLSQNALLDVSGNGGGTVLIRGGRLMVDGSFIFANTLGDVDGTRLGLDLRLTDDIVITNGGVMTTDSWGAGRAGDLRLTAGSVHMTDGPFIGSTAFASGDGGNVTLNVGKLTLDRAATIAADTWGAGHAGTVTVTATDSVAILGERKDGFTSFLFSATEFGSSGDAGRVVISAPVLLVDDALISAGTGGTGRAGDIEVFVGKLTLANGAQIGSGTFGVGNAGTVRVVATESVSISGIGRDGNRAGLFSTAERSSSGDGGGISVSTPVLILSKEGNISASTASTGRAGNIVVDVGKLTVTSGAKIGSSTFSSGSAGTVTITATDSIVISGRDSNGVRTGLFSQSLGSGDAGRIVLSASTVRIEDGGLIQASTTGDGHGGDIMVQVGTLTLRGDAQISSSTVGVGRGGNVTIAATEQIELSDGGTVSARSSGQGDAGNILIQAGQIFRSRHGAVTTEAETADGGNITLTAGSLVDLHDSQITATVKSGVGKGGNITIDPQSVVLQRSQIRADAFGGPGGNVRIIAEVFLADPDSRVSASSALGIAGEVDIRAPVTNLSGVVTPLPPEFAQVATLLRDRCAARLREGAVSSLVERGRDGVPANPEGVLPSRLYRGHPGAATSTSETAVSQPSGRRLDHQGQLQVRRRPAPKGSLRAQNEECLTR